MTNHGALTDPTHQSLTQGLSLITIPVLHEIRKLLQPSWLSAVFFLLLFFFAGVVVVVVPLSRPMLQRIVRVRTACSISVYFMWVSVYLKLLGIPNAYCTRFVRHCAARDFASCLFIQWWKICCSTVLHFSPDLQIGGRKWSISSGLMGPIALHLLLFVCRWGLMGARS